MQRRGKTAAGTQRWLCISCAQSDVKKRPDNLRRIHEKMFKQWLTGNATLADLAVRYQVSIQTIHAWLKDFWQQTCAAISRHPVFILILDATGMSKDCVLLIGLNAETNTPTLWYPAFRETYLSWKIPLSAIPYTPAYAVVDGHPGLRRAILERWPQILIQRCHAHVLREMRGFLTLNPKLQAGIDLRILVEDLRLIATRKQKRRWVHRLYQWRKKYESFLKEKTKTPDGHWRFTHRRLRRARSHLFNALPDLFRYIRDRRVPKTSNQLEGGINSPIKDLVRKHRGLVTYKKLILAAQYLKKRRRKTSTRL